MLQCVLQSVDFHVAKHSTQGWVMVLPAGLGSAEALRHRLGQCSLCLRLSQALMSNAWIKAWQTGEAAAAGPTVQTSDLKLRVGRFNSINGLKAFLCWAFQHCHAYLLGLWIIEPRRHMHCKCWEGSRVSTSVHQNKYQYPYWYCWGDTVLILYWCCTDTFESTISRACIVWHPAVTMELPYLMLRWNVTQYEFCTGLAHCQQLCSPLMNMFIICSPGVQSLLQCAICSVPSVS